ncbi:transporter substrate-binding domain-containing protein [Azospirillum doebereinerae]|uniref:Transporter substrate-binding domain-containing protein n=1 Tax=Azospirillum doebereinerae TaxID=92933 RepID=A0A433J0V9_9PROT|nr:transporter substrate-binding domain-containing protein [Azospirillum doebereinerae]RUQ63287.1 transporter substrate-binding domain-containing protein [Azospirillum doebereinerae]
MRVFLTRLLVAAAVLTAMPAAWAADDALQGIRQAGILRVGTTGDYKPFSYKGDDGALVGADVEMAKELATALGVRAEFVPTTWKTLIEDLKADKFDVALGGITVNPDRAAVGDFSVPNVTDGKRPIARCADKEKFTTVEAIDQPATRVVVNPGGTNEKFARASFTKAPIEVWPDNRTIFAQIAANKADVMVTDGVEADLQAKLNPGVLCAVPVAAPFTHFENAYLLRKDPALKQAVDQWMTTALSNGLWKAKLDAAMR